MSYTIFLTNGSTLTDLTNGTIDQTSTDLTLIGQNTTGYGLFVNDNFVHLLENFANTTEPNYPLTGQVWYDTSQGRLKVYDGTAFKVSGGALVSNSIPSTIATGDIWIDSSNSQIWFNDGTKNTLAGPIYTRDQGLSGFETLDIVDVGGTNHTIVLLYVGGTLMGIFAKEAFTPSSSITGFTSTADFIGSQSGTTLTVTSVISGTLFIGQTVIGLGIPSDTTITGFLTGTGNIGTYSLSTSATVSSTDLRAIYGTLKVGFNVSTYSNISFNVPVSQATKILAEDGSLKGASQFLSTDSYSTATTGSIAIQNDTPLILGTASQNQIKTDDSTIEFKSTASNQNFKITTFSGITSSTALFINANTQQVGVFTDNPITTLDVNGSFRIATSFTPASSSDTGVAGQIAWDSSYLYICIATNTWRRITIPGSGW
jgi:hypothetical protein